MSQSYRPAAAGTGSSMGNPSAAGVPVKLGDYEIRALLWEGFTGRVYRARGADGRRVLLRVLPAAVGAEPAYQKRFEQDVRAMAELIHPHVVPLLDWGVTPEGHRYLVSEAPEGVTLRKVLTDTPGLDPARVCRMMMHLARALAHARVRGVLHGNLKPESIILCPGAGGSETARLLDMGVASLGRLRAGGAGPVMGTPRYMSPEQLRGVKEDAHSDVFALACVALEALCGRPPYDGADLTSLARAHAQGPRSAAALGCPHRLSPSMEGLLQRMLLADPAGRPSGGDLVELIEVLPEYPDEDGELLGGPSQSGPELAPTEERSGPSLGLPPAGAHRTPGLAPLDMDRGGPDLIHVGDHRPDDVPRAPRDASANRLGLVGGLLGACSLAAVLAVWMWPAPAPSPQPAEPEASGHADPAAPAGAAPAEEASIELDVSGLRLIRRPKARGAAATGAKPVAPPQSRLTRVVVTSTPPGATVLEGSIVRGTTPTTVVMPRSGSARTLVLRLDGHPDAERVVVPDQDVVEVQVGFSAVAALPAAAAPTPAAAEAEPIPAADPVPAPATVTTPPAAAPPAEEPLAAAAPPPEAPAAEPAVAPVAAATPAPLPAEQAAPPPEDQAAAPATP